MMTSSDMNIGYDGQGSLLVESGGGVESARGSVAGSAVAVGTATITGAVSCWTVTEDLHIGARWDSTEYGQGTLNVHDNGTVRVGSLLNLGDHATVDVTGGGYAVVGSTAHRIENTLEVATGGTLTGTGTIIGDLITSGGVIRPGHSPGTLFVVGNFHLDPNAELSLEFAGSPESGLFDQIVVSGITTLAGNVTFDFTGFTPSPGMTYDFLRTTDGPFGEFSQWNVVGLQDGMSLNYDPSTGHFSTVPEPGTLGMMVIGAAVLGLIGYRRSCVSRSLLCSQRESAVPRIPTENLVCR
jgi:T5SS/PEP-CTERM-associated repeat protein